MLLIRSFGLTLLALVRAYRSLTRCARSQINLCGEVIARICFPWAMWRLTRRKNIGRFNDLKFDRLGLKLSRLTLIFLWKNIRTDIYRIRHTELGRMIEA